MLASDHVRVHFAGLGRGELKMTYGAKTYLVLLFEQCGDLSGGMRLGQVLLELGDDLVDGDVNLAEDLDRVTVCLSQRTEQEMLGHDDRRVESIRLSESDLKHGAELF